MSIKMPIKISMKNEQSKNLIAKVEFWQPPLGHHWWYQLAPLRHTGTPLVRSFGATETIFRRFAERSSVCLVALLLLPAAAPSHLLTCFTIDMSFQISVWSFSDAVIWCICASQVPRRVYATNDRCTQRMSGCSPHNPFTFGALSSQGFQTTQTRLSSLNYWCA